MQFSQQPQGISTYHEEIRNRLSYEARTRLNSIIGSLRLLADELVDTPEEQNELLEESYSSAISILNTIEFFENSANLPLK
jgi:signal transduction histidine kinase